jgi:hypothetical protein
MRNSNEQRCSIQLLTGSSAAIDSYSLLHFLRKSLRMQSVVFDSIDWKYPRYVRL